MTIRPNDDSAPVTAAWQVSKLEFDVVWEHLRLGPFPTVYRMLGHGQTHDERARLVEQAWTSLQAKGVGGAASLDPLLSELLTVLARPEREVDARFGHRGREVRALAGVAGERAALGVLDHDGFRLSDITPGGLSRAMVGLLPAHPAGEGHSVTLSSASFRAACEASGNTAKGLRATLIGRGLRPADADQLAEALDGAFSGGQFGAAMRDRWGRRHRAGYVVGFVDSPSGRYLLESQPALGGCEQWTTIAPTDPPRLAARIDQLLAGLGRAIDI
jgi:EspG family